MESTIDYSFLDIKNKKVESILCILNEISYCIDKEFDCENCEILFNELYKIFCLRKEESNYIIEMINFINYCIFNEEEIININLFSKNINYFEKSNEVKLGKEELIELSSKINEEIINKNFKEKKLCFVTNVV